MALRRDTDMTQGPILRLILGFAAPLMIGLVFQQLYNTVDAAVVGRYVGRAALAAVGSTGSIVNMLVGLCSGLATGATVVISQHYGSHDAAGLSRAVQTTIMLTALVSIAATAVGIVIVTPMLRFMDTPADVFEQAKEYLTIYFAGVGSLITYNMCSGILRAVGDSRRPLYFLCVTSVVNIVLDILFVVKFNMGIAGVAYATIIAQTVSSILVLIVLTRTHAPYRVRWGELAIDRPILSEMLKIGLPMAFQMWITAFSNVFVQSYINAFGTACIAGWSSFNKIDIFAVMPLQSISMASSTFVAQNYGARDLERAKKGVSVSIRAALTTTAVLIAAVLVFRMPLLRLFSDDAEVLQYGSAFLKASLPFYLFFAFTQIFSGSLRGTGESRKPMIASMCTFVALRQIYLFIAERLGWGAIAMGMSYPVGWVSCSIVLFFMYRRSRLFSGAAAPPCAADAAVAESEAEDFGQ